MRGLRILVSMLVALVGLPAMLYAQASIAGQVKDASGAILPGVTVEASSAALIEKVRSAVTDGSGQYRIELLPPGDYAVTFSLPGFSTVRREGIQLTGTFTANVDADLRVGALEETITVTGESPIVDVQSATRQRVIDRELIDSVPAGRSPFAQMALIPGCHGRGQQSGRGRGHPALGCHHRCRCTAPPARPSFCRKTGCRRRRSSHRPTHRSRSTWRRRRKSPSTTRAETPRTTPAA